VLSGIWLLFCVFIEPSPSDFLFCAALLLGLITGHYRPKLSGSSLAVALLFFTYFIACIPGIIAAGDKSGALKYFSVTLFLFFTALFLGTYGQKNNINSLLRAYILAAFLSFLAGFIGYCGVFRDYLMADDYRVKGLFKDPNVFGPFFVPAILLVISDIKQRVLLKTRIIVHILLIFFLTLGVVFSFSRGAWVSLCISLFFYFVLTGELKHYLKPRRFVAVAALLALFVGVLFSPPLKSAGISDFLLERAQLQDYDVNRFRSQQGGLELALENPLGIGPGQFENKIGAITKYRLSAHSLYIRTAAENGFIGAVSLLAALGCLLLSMFRLYMRKTPVPEPGPLPAGDMTASSDGVVNAAERRKSGPLWKTCRPDKNPILAAVIAILIGLLVSGLEVDTLHWRHFWFFIGIGLYFVNFE
jgi:O-antigen ligase